MDFSYLWKNIFFQPQKDSADKHTCPKLIIKTLNQGFECCTEITQSYPFNVVSTKGHIYHIYT